MTILKPVLLTSIIFFVGLLTHVSAKRISIIADERGSIYANEYLLADITAAALISKYDCEAVLRLESGFVFDERVIRSLSSLDHTSAISQIREVPCDILLYTRSINSSNFSIHHGHIASGMGKRMSLQKFLAKKISSGKWMGRRSYYPAAHELADKIAKIYSLPLKNQQKKLAQPDDISVAVMSPKIARNRYHTNTQKIWHQSAQAVQPLIEGELQRVFPQITLLDREMLPQIIQEKELSFIGKSMDSSINTMRLLSADFIIRPVVAMIDTTSTDPKTKTKKPGIEITLNIIRTSDGTVCNSLMHKGPYSTDAIAKMIPHLRFPKPRQEKKTPHPPKDDVLVQSEVDFFLGLTEMSSFRIDNNLIFQSRFNFKCAMTAFALGHLNQRNRQRVLRSAGTCYTQQIPSLRRDPDAVQVRKSVKTALTNQSAKKLLPTLQKDITLFYDLVSSSLDPQKTPRETLHRAEWLMVSARSEQALQMLEQYRQLQLQSGAKDPRNYDYYFRFIGIKALTKLNRPEICIQWIQQQHRIDKKTMFRLADCFAAIKDYQKEFNVLKENRTQYAFASFYGKRLIELAHQHKNTDFIYHFILTGVFSSAYNLDYTQWELSRSLHESGYPNLAHNVIQGYRSRKRYSSQDQTSKKWEDAAIKYSLPQPKQAIRQFPYEINPIGTDKIIEIIPIGPRQNKESINKAAHQIATLLGCKVHLYPTLPDFKVAGVYDMVGKFYYAKETLQASIHGYPPHKKAIDRIILTNRKTIIMENGIPTITPYSASRLSGKVVYMGAVPNKSRTEYENSLTLISLKLSGLAPYADKRFKITKSINGFLPILPDYLARNMTYHVQDRMRASLCQHNATSYKKINWDEYLQDYQRTISNAKKHPQPHLAQAYQAFRTQLTKSAPKIKEINPSQTTPQIKSLRHFE